MEVNYRLKQHFRSQCARAQLLLGGISFHEKLPLYILKRLTVMNAVVNVLLIGLFTLFFFYHVLQTKYCPSRRSADWFIYFISFLSRAAGQILSKQERQNTKYSKKKLQP